MSTTFNKVQTSDGRVLIDLSQDTVTSAAHIVSGHTGHLADGSQVAGTGGGGLTTEITVPEQSVTASREDTQLTANEAIVLGDWYVVTIDGVRKVCTAISMWGDIHLVFEYGKLHVITPGNASTVYLEISDSSYYGTYTVKVEKIIDGIPTLITKNITQNGTYAASSDNADGYSSVTVNVSGSANLQAKTNIAPTTSSQTITADAGYDGLSSVQINAMPSGTEGTPTATKGSVSNHSVSVTPSVTNTAGYISGGTHNGTAVSVSASELVSGTYTVDSSGTKDVTNYASASVPAGTAGTPSAAKGTVSNHSVTVTPSVTNSTGWISGGTKNGTAVTVSASELVSGSETKTANGTYDVTNLAELVVNVSGGGSSKNAQVSNTPGRAASSTYTAVGPSLTVSKTGTYHVYWSGYRSSTSGTNGSQLYINSTAYGSANTTFETGSGLTNIQEVHLTNVSLSQNDVLTIRARSRGNNYYMYILNLVIIEA